MYDIKMYDLNLIRYYMSKKSKISELELCSSLLDDKLDLKDGKLLYKGKYLDEELYDVIKSKDGNNKFELIEKLFSVDALIEGKVYIISSKNTDKVYIGSTYNSLEKRLEIHEISFYGYDMYRLDYCSSYEVMKYGEYSIAELESKVCDIKELEKHESIWISRYGDRSVNVLDPYTKIVLKGKEIGKMERKKEKWDRLFDICKRCVRADGMTREELIILKSLVINNMRKNIIEYGKIKVCVEFNRLGKINDDIFK
jgi:hypothetical protein